MIPWQRSTVATELDVARRIYSRTPMASQQLSASRAGGVLGGQSGNLAMRYGTAIADSADGWVNVHLDLAESESDYVVCICDSPISEGQRVSVLVTDSGQLKAIPIGDNILSEAEQQIGNPVVNTDIQWAGSDSGTTPPTDGWSQTWPAGSDYVWQRQMVEKRDGTITYSDPACVSRPPEGYDSDATVYATSSSSSSDTNKTATVQSGSLTLSEGAVVSVTFANANTAASPTLNVGGTGIYPIRTLGTSSAYWAAGQSVLFVFDGTYWQVASSPVWASTVTVGNPASRNIYITDDLLALRNGTTNYVTVEATGIMLGLDNSGTAMRLSSSGTISMYRFGDVMVEVGSNYNGAYITTQSDQLTMRSQNGGSTVSVDNTSISLSAEYGVEMSHAARPLAYSSNSLDVMGATVLYASSSGTAGTARLNRSADGFNVIEIFYEDDSGRVQSARTCGTTGASSISSTVSTSVALGRGVASGSTVYQSAEYVTVSGTTITRHTCNQAALSQGSVQVASAIHNIVAVIGWGL